MFRALASNAIIISIIRLLVQILLYKRQLPQESGKKQSSKHPARSALSVGSVEITPFVEFPSLPPCLPPNATLVGRGVSLQLSFCVLCIQINHRWSLLCVKPGRPPPPSFTPDPGPPKKEVDMIGFVFSFFLYSLSSSRVLRRYLLYR
ncbi:hypothetical protein F4778DRAFT_747671 [Xylariomycetidae sp. FL2044]|nr:hypothetical protein F4778DRAFT_747671 [Xylariomycetidae sp. FL2044]